MGELAKMAQEATELARKKFFKGVPDDDFKLTMLIANKYGLDPLLKHLVLIPARGGYSVYVTRDGLLHIAHSSGKPWSLRIGEPEVRENPYTGQPDVYLAGTVTVRDPETGTDQEFTAGLWLSEYDTKTGAWKTHRGSMHAKVLEVYLLRRAFDVSLTPVEEIERVNVNAAAAVEATGPVVQPAAQPQALPNQAASPPEQQAAKAVPMITGEQATKIAEAMKALGFDGSEKSKLLAGTVTEHIIGRPVESVKGLTKPEATKVLSQLNSFRTHAEAAGVGDPEGFRDVLAVLVGKGGKLTSKKDIEEALDDLLSGGGQP